MKVEIYSILGKLISSENIMGGLQQIDLSNEAKGIYFIKLKDGNMTKERL